MIKPIFIIQAYDYIDETGTLHDLCTLEVFAKDAKTALKKAKNYIDKKNYRISRVIEKNDT